MISYVYSLGLTLMVETNGTLCTEEVSALLSKGTCSVSVSLDGADSKTHDWMRGVSGSFDAALTGIRNLVKYNINPVLVVSLAKHNYKQIVSIKNSAELEKCSCLNGYYRIFSRLASLNYFCYFVATI
jgi:MoaA/NifB/PqqE/SkfB family radical SAM enzyme